ncbi:hypothetical protein [Streptomyces sp. NPDC088812]|uniref:phosphorylase family protein n=1 Tax=Streptomyces sp. NPDC088812 TaxID=3365905 RepID=UPI00382B0F07
MDADNVDAFVLTAVEPEYRAVVGHLEPGRSRRSADGAAYEVGHFHGERGRLRVAVQLGGAGNELAAALAERAVARLRPAVLLFVGVAGGRKDVRLGDVVAADTVYGYESGRDEADGFRPRIKSWPSSFALVQRARLVAADGRWRRRIRPSPPRPPAAYVGALAAGAKVVADAGSTSGRLLREVTGDALAVEMEGLGLLTAARINPRVQALVVRGVSDLLGDKDEGHDAHWQPVAARHAAAFAFELLALTEARVTTTPPQGLTARQTGELATLLLGVPGIDSPASWQMLLDQLPRIGVMTSRQQNSRLEAVSLVRTCEDLDGWQSLLDALEALWPDTPAVRQVRHYLDEHRLV